MVVQPRDAFEQRPADQYARYYEYHGEGDKRFVHHLPPPVDPLPPLPEPLPANFALPVVWTHFFAPRVGLHLPPSISALGVFARLVGMLFYLHLREGKEVAAKHLVRFA